VHDSGAGASPAQLERPDATGLRRLRDRLRALYGRAARLELASGDGGFTATLVLPRRLPDE
jgi:LytS/YehU family sensor histidine kinase